MSLISVSLWELSVYGVTIALFLTAFYLALQDMRVKRRRDWTKIDSAALFIRYYFYGSLTALIITLCTLFFLWILNILILPIFALNVILPLNIPIFSLLMFLFSGIAYAVAKAKHLYELIDEELYGFKPWWLKRVKLRRLLGVPLYFSDGDYRRWKNAQLTPRKLIKLKRKLNLEFPKDREDLIGRDTEYQTLMTSIFYHVLRDPEIREIFASNPPPKFFILKGMTGTGKTLLAEVCMRDAILQGIERQTNVSAKSIKSADVFNPYYGESARNLMAIFKEALRVPSVLFFDEFDSFAKRVGRDESHWAQMEDLRVQSTFIEGLKKVLDTEARVVIITATNSFESVREDIRRRAHIIDLDQNVTRDMLMAVLKSELRKNKWTYLDPAEIMDTLEKAVSVYRQTQLTPFDIIDACQKVKNMKIEPIRKNLFKFERSRKVKSQYKVSIDDFKIVARALRGYLEKEKSSEVISSVLKIKPSVTYKDVGGLFGIKEKIFKTISLSLKPELATKLGWIPPKGFILWGEPGCGKTHISKAIAKENNATFFYAPAAQLLINAKWVGEPEKNVRDLFDLARKEAPSIIFFDEFDIIAGKRRGDPVGDKITAQILTELDGLQPLENVIVIAATNRLDSIDEAVLNRFEPNLIEIPVPRNDEERLDIISIHLNRYLQHLHPEVTPERVLKILKQHRMVSPRIVAEIIKEANRLRSQEIFAAWELNKTSKNEMISDIFKEDLDRLKHVLEIMKNNDGKEIAIEDISGENYKVRLYHFEKAAELLEHEIDLELIEAQESVISSDSEPGISYGLATDQTGRRGIILIVECIVNERGQGEISVTGAAKTAVIGPGTTVKDESVIESAVNVVNYIRKYLREKLNVDISNYDFTFQIISPLEGTAGMGVSGPSLGVALSTAAISELAKLSIKPEIVMTGKGDIKGNVGPVGGLGWRGTGKLLAAIRTKNMKIKKFLIPQWNYEKSRDEWNILEDKGIKVIPIRKQVEAWLYALDIDEAKLLENLKSHVSTLVP
ncbi:MAG: AAA family ATPase [Candidatus Odinarchaeia archaeon]